ncbi:MAG TPA: hypothetical protein VE085_02625 [Burkholderiales bacterium]|nr:hypothetical protein [Burkholderiales bacterium]
MKAPKPEFVAAKSRFLRRRRILKAVRDVERGAKDTERRGAPSEVPHDTAKRRRV